MDDTLGMYMVVTPLHPIMAPVPMSRADSKLRTFSFSHPARAYLLTSITPEIPSIAYRLPHPQKALGPTAVRFGHRTSASEDDRLSQPNASAPADSMRPKSTALSPAHSANAPDNTYSTLGIYTLVIPEHVWNASSPTLSKSGKDAETSAGQCANELSPIELMRGQTTGKQRYKGAGNRKKRRY